MTRHLVVSHYSFVKCYCKSPDKFIKFPYVIGYAFIVGTSVFSVISIPNIKQSFQLSALTLRLLPSSHKTSYRFGISSSSFSLFSLCLMVSLLTSKLSTKAFPLIVIIIRCRLCRWEFAHHYFVDIYVYKL